MMESELSNVGRSSLSVFLASTSAVLSILLGGCGESPGSLVDTARILAADDEPGSWLTHGRTYSEQRFSPLNAIDRETVSELALAWSAELSTTRGVSATPLVVDGVMYVTSAWSVVHALDARTGEPLWVHDPEVDRSMAGNACCDVTNRGVAVYDGAVFVGVIDGRLQAIDASTGSLAWEVMTVDPSWPYTITGAPRAANGRVFIGNGGAEYGVRGYVSAYDAETGELAWRFYTVPGNPADGPDGAASDPVMGMAADTWTGQWWTLGGGGTAWDAIVYDPDFDQVLVGVGNGAPQNREERSPDGGDNLFLSSVVALDAATGVYRWHYQTTPGDTWDFTATQSIILADLDIGGEERKVALQAPKNGFFYVIDREDGRLHSAAPIVPMQHESEVPPYGPISWAYGIDEATGRPLENPSARYEDGSVLIRPHAWGAHNWHPMSFSPVTGFAYIPVQDLALSYAQDADFEVVDGVWNEGISRLPFPDDTAARRSIKEGASGALIAWDPVLQEEAWRVDYANPWNGGTLVTEGGIVFQGTADGRFLAFDAATGDRLWEHDNQLATLAGPVTYELDGEQFVAVAAGYGSVFFLLGGFFAPEAGVPVKGRVYSFKLGGTSSVPEVARPDTPTPAPPDIEVSASEYGVAQRLYGRFCLRCHGIAAISGGVLPDLRKSAYLQAEVPWQTVVSEGALASMGMPRFGAVLEAGEVELIRAYVARQAEMLYAEEQSAGPGNR